MSSIRVNWQTAATAVDEYDAYRQDLSSAMASVRSVRSYRCMEGRSFSAVFQLLDRVVRQLEDEKNDMRSLSNGLSDVLKTYRQSEGKAADAISGTTLQEENAQISAENNELPSWFPTANDFWKLISKFGIIGNGVSAIGTLISGDWQDPKVITNSGKYLLSMIGGAAAEAAKGTKAKWAEALLGLNTTASKNTNFFSELTKELGLNTPTTASEGIKLGTKWGGFVLTGISNFFENQQEFAGQEGSTGRMLAETVIETGVDIGTTAVVSAGVTAAAGALISAGLISAAPVVVTGAITVGVVWGVNALCKHFTGKDLAENVSDRICDTVTEKAQDFVGNVKSKFQSFVQWGQACFA